MANHEWRIISELLRSKDMSTATRLGLNEHQFKGDPEAGQAFDFIRAHYFSPDTYREWPTLHAIRKRFPAFRMTAESDLGQLGTLVKEMQGNSLGNDLRALVNYFDDVAQDEPFEAIRLMQSQLARLGYTYTPTSGFGLTDIAQGMKAHHEEAQTGIKMGIPYPWECLTYDSLGKHKGDLIVFYGRMKSMKTWIILYLAAYDYMINKRRVLLWSREMNEEKTKLRLASILGGVDYQCLKHGTVPAPLFAQAYRAVKKMAVNIQRTREEIIKDRERDLADIICLCGRRAPKTLEEVGVAAEAFGADVVYIDSFYHIETDRSVRFSKDNDRQRAVTEATKQSALDWDVPIVVSAQANREGEKHAGETLVDVGRTDAIGQEGDLICRVMKKTGTSPFEDDYEGYWETMKKVEKAKQRRRAVRPRISVPPKLRRPPRKAQAKTVRHKERKSAQVALLMGGNRDGVLDGMLLEVIPGYRFEVIRDDFTPAEAKKWAYPDKRKGKGSDDRGDTSSAGFAPESGRGESYGKG